MKNISNNFFGFFLKIKPNYQNLIFFLIKDLNYGK